ncbi:hypothetical protein Efla_004050 [Eimeria flavescens]
MTRMLFPYIGKGVVAHFDDLLFYSKDVESHANLLKQVMQFLGTVNYCRMFMGPDFAEVARPLMDLTKKGKPYIWEGKHAAAVRALKHRLLKCNVLQIPDREKPYVLKSDASAFAIGGVLEQDEKPLCFLSKKMSEVSSGTPFTISNTEDLSKSNAHLVEHSGKDISAIVHEIQGHLQASVSNSVSNTPMAHSRFICMAAGGVAFSTWSSASNICRISTTIIPQQAMWGSPRPAILPREPIMSQGPTQDCSGQRRYLDYHRSAQSDGTFCTYANYSDTRRCSSALSGPFDKTNAQMESVHRTLEQVLRTYIQSDEAAWEGLLPAVELAYSCTTHTSTGL